MLIMKSKLTGIDTIVKILSFIAIILFIGPFYFDSPYPDTIASRRKVRRQMKKNELDIRPSENISEVSVYTHPQMAVFKDGVLGNYETPNTTNRTGPGQYGEAVEMLDSEREEAELSVREYGYNMVSSDKITLDRTIQDKRIKECLNWQYPSDLPSASVIIVFYNEGLSVLLRTVHSVVNTSPLHLLKEIILIDDCSDKENLQYDLQLYLEKFAKLVKLYRNKVREGLIRSRTKGALLANADVIVFLDAHCECNKNWLPPLLTRIAYDRTIMAVPIIDYIDWNTFEYSVPYPGINRWGIFEWSLLYKENIVPSREEGTRRYRSEPYKSPTHAGGLFAIDRKYFFELGGYDPGLEIWGGENFELSFKIWQCGGSIEWVPCSQVGHVYKRAGARKSMPESKKIPSTIMNYMRVVEVWFDEEYRKYFYRRQPWLYGTPLQNLQPQIDFRRKYNCKSFRWYLENVAYDVSEKFPVPLPNLHWGHIRPWYTDLCWTSTGQREIRLLSCLTRPYASVQFFRLDVDGHLNTGEMCVLYSKDKNFPVLAKCAEEPKSVWQYNKEKMQLKNKDIGLCVEFDDDTLLLTLKSCNHNTHNQKWTFKKIHMWK